MLFALVLSGLIPFSMLAYFFCCVDCAVYSIFEMNIEILLT